MRIASSAAFLRKKVHQDDRESAQKRKKRGIPTTRGLQGEKEPVNSVLKKMTPSKLGRGEQRRAIPRMDRLTLRLASGQDANGQGEGAMPNSSKPWDACTSKKERPNTSVLSGFHRTTLESGKSLIYNCGVQTIKGETKRRRARGGGAFSAGKKKRA